MWRHQCCWHARCCCVVCWTPARAAARPVWRAGGARRRLPPRPPSAQLRWAGEGSGRSGFASRQYAGSQQRMQLAAEPPEAARSSSGGGGEMFTSAPAGSTARTCKRHAVSCAVASQHSTIRSELSRAEQCGLVACCGDGVQHSNQRCEGSTRGAVLVACKGSKDEL